MARDAPIKHDVDINLELRRGVCGFKIGPDSVSVPDAKIPEKEA
jgi:hypothetical protein